MHSVILKRAYFLIKSLIPNQVASVTSKLECTYNEVNQANQVKKNQIRERERRTGASSTMAKITIFKEEIYTGRESRRKRKVASGSGNTRDENFVSRWFIKPLAPTYFFPSQFFLRKPISGRLFLRLLFTVYIQYAQRVYKFR